MPDLKLLNTEEPSEEREPTYFERHCHANTFVPHDGVIPIGMPLLSLSSDDPDFEAIIRGIVILKRRMGREEVAEAYRQFLAMAQNWKPYR